MKRSRIALAIFVLALGVQTFSDRSVAMQSRELSFVIYADERLTTTLSGPVDFGPVPAGSLSRNGTPTSVWIVNTGQKIFILTDFQSDSLVGTVIFSPSRPDVLPGQEVQVGLTFKANFQAPLGPFVASMRMMATNEFGSDPINLTGLGGIIPPAHPIPEFPSGLLTMTLAGALLVITAMFRRRGKDRRYYFPISVLTSGPGRSRGDMYTHGGLCTRSMHGSAPGPLALAHV